jgi:hypothetical protein
MSTSKPNAIQFLAVLLAFTVLLVLGAVAASTSDLLWFWPRFSAQPERIAITRDGQQTILTPDDPGYSRVVQALNQTLSQVDRWEERGLSPDTLEEYHIGQALVLEAYYAQPQRVHSRFAFGAFRCLLLPLEGTHAERRLVFGGNDGEYRSGALVLRDTGALAAVVREVVSP